MDYSDTFSIRRRENARRGGQLGSRFLATCIFAVLAENKRVSENIKTFFFLPLNTEKALEIKTALGCLRRLFHFLNLNFLRRICTCVMRLMN